MLTGGLDASNVRAGEPFRPDKNITILVTQRRLFHPGPNPTPPPDDLVVCTREGHGGGLSLMVER